MDLLDELLTALLRELREVQADGLAVVLRVDAKVRLLNGALDGLERRAVPRGDDELTRIRRGDGRDLLNGRGRAIVVNADAVEHGSVGAACAHGSEVCRNRLDALSHFVGIDLIIFFIHGETSSKIVVIKPLLRDLLSFRRRWYRSSRPAPREGCSRDP